MTDFTAANTEILSPKDFVVDDVELYTEHMDYYFDVQINQTAKEFTDEEKDEMFHMFHEHSDIIKKLIHAKIPLVEYVLGNPWPPKEVLEDPKYAHIKVRDYDCWLIGAYEEWKKSKGL